MATALNKRGRGYLADERIVGRIGSQTQWTPHSGAPTQLHLPVVSNSKARVPRCPLPSEHVSIEVLGLAASVSSAPCVPADPATPHHCRPAPSPFMTKKPATEAPATPW